LSAKATYGHLSQPNDALTFQASIVGVGLIADINPNWEMTGMADFIENFDLTVDSMAVKEGNQSNSL
jgi:hypothetical protein